MTEEVASVGADMEKISIIDGGLAVALDKRALTYLTS
jgi:hypothetical protein